MMLMMCFMFLGVRFSAARSDKKNFPHFPHFDKKIFDYFQNPRFYAGLRRFLGGNAGNGSNKRCSHVTSTG
jgi:hypothetical protein